MMPRSVRAESPASVAPGRAFLLVLAVVVVAAIVVMALELGEGDDAPSLSPERSRKAPKSEAKRSGDQAEREAPAPVVVEDSPDPPAPGAPDDTPAADPASGTGDNA